MNEQNNQTKEIEAPEKKIPLRTNTNSIIAIALIVLILGFGGLLAWASLAPLDKGVVASGVIKVASYRKTIQHQYGGTVEEILVREGDRIKKGQVLIRLNDVQAKANLSHVRSEYLADLGLEARLLSERRMADRIIFPREITALKGQPEIDDIISRQEELFRTRRNVLENEKKILRENIGGLEVYISRLEELQASRGKQIELIMKETEPLRDLAEQGYYPRNRILEMERVLADLQGRRSEDLGNIARSRTAVSELKMKITRLEQEFLKEVDTQSTEVQKKVVALKDQYEATADVLERTKIRAPEDSIVIGLRMYTPGGVIMPGHPVLDLIPLNAELIVEAWVMPNDIDKVHTGLKADLRFSAFRTPQTPVAEGEVVLVSADRMLDEGSRIAHYVCRIKITEKGLKDLKELTLQPGMPVEVILKTGERTLISYLLKPLLNRLAISFKEE